MVISLKFDNEKVKKLEEDYSKIQVSPSQRAMVDQISRLLEPFLPLSLMAIKGNAWFSIKQWQEENKCSLEDIEKMPPQDRGKAAMDLFNLGKERVVRLLVHPDEEQKRLIDEAYAKGIKVYEQYKRLFHL